MSLEHERLQLQGAQKQFSCEAFWEIVFGAGGEIDDVFHAGERFTSWGGDQHLPVG